MKNLAIILLISTLISCENFKGPVGPQGEQGEQGEQGIAGEKGSTGAQGPSGNANVIYSDWISLNTIITGNDIYSIRFQLQDSMMPLITQDILDKGIVLIYFKGNQKVQNPISKLYDLKEFVAEGQMGVDFKIPGRSTNFRENFTYAAVYDTKIYGLNTIKIDGYILKRTMSDNGNEFDIPEFEGRSNTYFPELIRNLVKYRVIVIEGSKKGRYASVNWNNYEEVKKVLNLKD